MNQNLYKNAINYYNSYKNESFVVKPSIPILYFGNYEEYKISEKKIITCALNPSSIEFFNSISNDINFRFHNNALNSSSDYFNSLNNYFIKNPYKRWFNSFEPILKGANASFYSNLKYKNRVLHTDYCSILATSPTWSYLYNNQITSIFSEGSKLWYELVEYLQPDVILISFARKYFKMILNYYNKTNSQNIIMNLNNPRIAVEESIIRIGNKNTKLIFSQGGRTPFMYLNESKYSEKTNLGKML